MDGAKTAPTQPPAHGGEPAGLRPAAATPRRPEQALDASVIAEVRPADWRNPAPPSRYDLLIVGGSSLAVAAAERAARMGVRVGLASDDPLGFDALLDAAPRGVLLHTASQVCQLQRATDTAWPEARLGTLDVATLEREMRAARQQAAARFAARGLAERGMDVFFGPLTFTGPSALKVGGQTLNFARALLAPAARTVLPTIPGLEGIGYHTPQTLFALAAPPRRLVVLGAGSTACELAQAFRRLGSEIDLVFASRRLLADDEPVVGEQVQRQLIADGVHIHARWVCASVERTGSARGLVLERGGRRKKLLADEILFCGPGHCELGWLRVATAGLLPKMNGRPADAGGWAIRRDKYGRTRNRRIYTIDPNEVPDGLNAAAIGVLANLLVGNALGWRPTALDARYAPRWQQTDPPVCWIGRAVTQSSQAGTAWTTTEAAPWTSHVYSLPAAASAGGVGDAWMAGGAAQAAGSWIVLRTETRSGRWVGATIVGAAARELAGPLAQRLERAGRGKIWRAFADWPSPGDHWPAWLQELWTELSSRAGKC